MDRTAGPKGILLLLFCYAWLYNNVETVRWNALKIYTKLHSSVLKSQLFVCQSRVSLKRQLVGDKQGDECREPTDRDRQYTYITLATETLVQSINRSARGRNIKRAEHAVLGYLFIFCICVYTRAHVAPFSQQKHATRRGSHQDSILGVSRPRWKIQTPRRKHVKGSWLW